MKVKRRQVVPPGTPGFLLLLFFVPLLLMSGCSGTKSDDTKKPGTASPAMTEHEIGLDIHGRRFVIKAPVQMTAKSVLTAAGPQGFYWALPQTYGKNVPGQVDESAVIHYTPYDRQGVIDPETEPVIYHLPADDPSRMGDGSGVLHLQKIELRGKWLFYQYNSEIKDAARLSYTALGVLDTSAEYPENTARFLYRGYDSGGGQVEWAASENYVVWQQGRSGDASVHVTTNLYDLKTGEQQAILPSADQMTPITLKGDTLQYKDATGVHALKLPPPGSGRLLAGARRLPSVAFGDLLLPDGCFSGGNFRGTVYLPAVVDPAPFYHVEAAVDATHYRVSFNASEYPVPMKATGKGPAAPGPAPSMAQTLGSIEGYTGTPAAVEKLLRETLPTGELFTLHVGKRMLTGHFLSSSASEVSVWWKDGPWRYRLQNLSVLWANPSDANLQKALKEVINELPPDGALVKGAEQGEVIITLAPDHRETNVWFRRGEEWVHLDGYGFDALHGAQTLVAVKITQKGTVPSR